MPPEAIACSTMKSPSRCPMSGSSPIGSIGCVPVIGRGLWDKSGQRSSSSTARKRLRDSQKQRPSPLPSPPSGERGFFFVEHLRERLERLRQILLQDDGGRVRRSLRSE